MRFAFLLVLTCVLCSSCGSAPPKSYPEFSVTRERFTAPLMRELTAEVGEHFFIEGEVVHVPVLVMSTGISSTMPGAYGVPFSFSINQSRLTLKFERGALTNSFVPRKEKRRPPFPASV